MEKSSNTTQENVRASISTIYSDLLNKRRIEREHKEELKRMEKEAKKEKKKEEKEKDEANMSKKERRQAELDSCKEIIVGPTGDDLEYSDSTKSKKKYRKWIDDESDQSNLTVAKPKKQKKKNYAKEFEPELQMLKSLVADQNRFSADLLKRYQNAAGPNTKDAMPPNKTIVELISTINASRANSLGMLREIGNIKKTIADLYMKQKKLDSDLGSGSNIGSTDIGLMGSNIASQLFGDFSTPQQSQGVQSPVNGESQTQYQPGSPIVASTTSPGVDFNGIQASSSFDPSTWEGPDLGESNYTTYEAIPHHVVVEWNKPNNIARFKAIRDDTGEELVGAPVPTSDPSKLAFNEKDLKVKGEFDEIYPLEIIGA